MIMKETNIHNNKSDVTMEKQKTSQQQQRWDGVAHYQIHIKNIDNNV